MPQVLNKRVHGIPAGSVYIGRPSKWGNPYSHLAGQGTLAKYQVGSRAEAVAAYKTWLLSQPELVKAARSELKNRDLVCWCAPASCHGDILLAIANSEDTP